DTQAAARTRTLQRTLESDYFHVESPMHCPRPGSKNGASKPLWLRPQNDGTNLRSFMPIVQKRSVRYCHARCAFANT
ncbi:hypothetical protein QMO17_29270, partial [Klebsiella pneumoniae]|nr:hypothetical protein [Klebsiella pneumoniae]